MAVKKRTLRAIDLNGNPLDQFSGNEFEIWEDTDGKVHITLDKTSDLDGSKIDELTNMITEGLVKVVANPEGEATGELTKVQIDNVIYELAGGTEVEANPELEGNEDALTGIEVDGTKYKIPEGTEVVANPTLAGTEDNLTGLQVGDIKYKVPAGGGNNIIQPVSIFDENNTIYDDASTVSDQGKCGDIEYTEDAEDLLLNIAKIMCKDMEIVYDENAPENTEVPNISISIPDIEGKDFFYCNVYYLMPDIGELGGALKLPFDNEEVTETRMLDFDAEEPLPSKTYTAADLYIFNTGGLQSAGLPTMHPTILAGYYVTYYNGVCEIHSLTENVIIPGTNTTTTVLDLIKGMYTLTIYRGFYREGSM